MRIAAAGDVAGQRLHVSLVAMGCSGRNLREELTGLVHP
jgi:hypothetical protein